MQASAASSSPDPLVASVLATNGPSLAPQFLLRTRNQSQNGVPKTAFSNSDIGHIDSFSGNVALMALSLNMPILFLNKIQLFGLPAELLATQRHSSTSPTIITELYTKNDPCIWLETWLWKRGMSKQGLYSS
jgi:hypothetical protein